MDDNLRWTVMTKIIMLILETCSIKLLTEVMVEYSRHFEDIIKKPFKEARDKEDPTEFY